MKTRSDLEACLPQHLRGPATAITELGTGLSGASVYRVEAGGRAFVLKIGSEAEPLTSWRRKREIQRLAADAGVTPAVVHADDERRAVLSDFVADRFSPSFVNPGTRAAVLGKLGRTVRRLHELAIPAGLEPADARGRLAEVWSALESRAGVPAFVGDAVRRALAPDAPPSGRARVLSHNDVNPGNIVYDGETLMLVDWEVSAPNDPFYDLATIAVFLRLDDATSRDLLGAYDGTPASAIPATFTYFRRLVGVLCGASLAGVAYSGADSAQTLDSTPSLGEFYRRLASGTLSLRSPEGQWWFGLALIKDSFAH